MKSSSLLVMAAWLAVLAAEMVSGESGQEHILGALKAMQNSSKALENDLKSFGTQVAQLANKVNKFMSEQTKLAEKIDQLMKAVRVDSKYSKLNEIVEECPKGPKKGVYELKPSLQQNRSFAVYCDEGWIVIQRRINGSLSFNRNWNEYRDGFGDMRGEHWLGLEKMHQITRDGSYELMVVFKNTEGVEKRAKYEWIKVDSESEQFRLNLGNFSESNVRDSLTSHNRMKFSTPDRDNDSNAEKHCAKLFGSGWWFTENCYYSNLNGEIKGSFSKIEWYDDCRKYEGLMEARMMIRAVK